MQRFKSLQTQTTCQQTPRWSLQQINELCHRSPWVIGKWNCVPDLEREADKMSIPGEAQQRQQLISGYSSDKKQKAYTIAILIPKRVELKAEGDKVFSSKR
ncbi:hypothetical protein TNCV_1568461 [Trichonephila clavipes]|nr:hypothetical protein TNCV_1568461 [Trichonephila clavipes]